MLSSVSCPSLCQYWLFKPANTEDAGKGKGSLITIALLTQVGRDQKHFAVLEVAANWHQLVMLPPILWPFSACTSNQLDLQSSRQTYHHLSHPHWAFTP